MKNNLFITDYDDTLTNDKKYLKENKKEINKWKKEGNIFGIATGRAYKSIQDRIKKDFRKIDYDYLITNHGATILNKENKIIKSNNISHKTLTKILQIINKKNIETVHKYTEKNEVIKENNKYNKIMLVYNTEENAKKDYDKIKQLKIVNVYLIIRKGQTPKVELINKNTNKSKAIKHIEQIEKINKVYVIGDANQDKPMLKTYNGYCVTNATEEIKKISKKEYESVAQMLKEINKK